MTLKSDAKFEEKLLLPKMTWGISSSVKSGNLHFDVLLLSIAYKVSAKEVQKNYLSSWHWKKSELLGSDFSFKKWHKEFGEL